MHQPAHARIRPNVVPGVTRGRPVLRVINGGRSPRKELATDPFVLLVFLYQVGAWRRNRPRPFPEEPGTGVRPKVRRKVADPTIAELRVKARQVLMFESGKMPMHVLNQYVRGVIGFADGLEEYLRRSTQEVIRRRDKRRQSSSFIRLWEQELYLLIEQARGFVAKAADTGERTRKGYFILRSIGARGRSVFLTIHNHCNSVVGIYTGAQFNRKKANRRWRSASHVEALAFRRAKAYLTPR